MEGLVIARQPYSPWARPEFEDAAAEALGHIPVENLIGVKEYEGTDGVWFGVEICRRDLTVQTAQMARMYNQAPSPATNWRIKFLTRYAAAAYYDRVVRIDGVPDKYVSDGLWHAQQWDGVWILLHHLHEAA
mmetsp:Transcript_10705/g.35098  ORF Transcript_10705/g.35098 Transcript_10705/m.35098 type:complete len:132 (-) Transcript_10705:104-499(-)